MINYWWVTRPKRKLTSIPEILAIFAESNLNSQWKGKRDAHLVLEDSLEYSGLKRKGERRDHTGSGGRTYKAWLESLGLIFHQRSTKETKLTLAGEAILNGESPQKVLTAQVLKYQFPSAFSIKNKGGISPRFKIHPFIFLLRLLMDERIGHLTKEEMANVVIVEAENESDCCFEYVVKRILDYRNDGESILPNDFNQRYGVSKGSKNLEDVANTMMNWLEYTMLTRRESGVLIVAPAKIEDVKKVINTPYPFINRPEEHEFYQRKYGIDPNHRKDTRNLNDTKTVTEMMIAEQQIIKAFMTLSLKKPITKIDASIIEAIVDTTGIYESIVGDILQKKYSHGAVGTFLTSYYDMAFSGKKEATQFETATVDIFENILGYEAKHVGPIGKTPDVLVLSDEEGYAGIIDNKAYRSYSISNDHHNRMVTNYINGIDHYYNGTKPLAFFSYIAGGFGKNIDAQIKNITKDTSTHGSAINVHNMIELVEKHSNKQFTHRDLKKIFTVDRQILLSDLDNV